MAIQANIVHAQNSETTGKLVNKMETDIDWALKNGKFEANMQNEFTVIIGGELDEVGKNLLADRYLKSGGKKMKIKSSSENGERPGLSRITLCK